MADLIEAKSTSVELYGYNPETKVLTIIFKGGAEYEYSNVPDEVFEEMITAESIGKFVHSKIRGHFESRKVERDEPVSPDIPADPR